MLQKRHMLWGLCFSCHFFVVAASVLWLMSERVRRWGRSVRSVAPVTFSGRLRSLIRRLKVMKKVLLGSTALLGFGLLSASALAQVELAISGNAQFEAGWVDEEDRKSVVSGTGVSVGVDLGGRR